LVLIPEASSVRGLVFWLLGGLSGAEWGSALVAGVVTLSAGAALLVLARWLDLLLLGDDAARALGLEVARARGVLVLLASLLTAAAVAFSGTIAFIGLVVPHILRPLAGPGHRRLLPLSALFGATLLVALDTLARTIAAPRELPVGVLSGLLGAPFFLWFLRRARVEVEGRG
jgi:iron complex transport system permease protein